MQENMGKSEAKIKCFNFYVHLALNNKENMYLFSFNCWQLLFIRSNKIGNSLWIGILYRLGILSGLNIFPQQNDMYNPGYDIKLTGFPTGV